MTVEQEGEKYLTLMEESLTVEIFSAEATNKKIQQHLA